MGIIVKIVLSVIALTIFGLLSASQWDKLRESKGSKKRWGKVLVFLLTVSGMVVSTWFSTYYWNDYFREIQDTQARDQMIHYLASEFVMNGEIMLDRAYTESDDSSLSQYIVYPQLQSDALQAALSSCLFGASDDKDLFTCIAGLKEKITDFNRRVTLTQHLMVTAGPRHISQFRKEMRDGKTRGQIVQQLQAFGRLLVEKYGISPNETFFK